MTGIGRVSGGGARAAREASMGVEQALSPREQWVVGLEQLLRRHDARPLEAAEEDVVGEARPRSADPRLLGHDLARGIERLAQRRDRLLRIGAELLERHAEALLARLAEIRLVLLVDRREKIEDDDAHDRGIQR